MQHVWRAVVLLVKWCPTCRYTVATEVVHDAQLPLIHQLDARATLSPVHDAWYS